MSVLFLCSLPTKAKVVGHKLWPADQAFEVDLSKAKAPGGNKKLFTTSTEAFIVTIYDSNHNKWTNMFEYYASENNYRATLPGKKSKQWRKDNPGQLDPYHDAKYTRQDGGQLEFGSFSDEGMAFYGEVGQEISKRRKEHPKEYLDFEAKFRPRLRQILGRPEEAANEDKKKGKKGRKTGEGGGQVKKRKIITFDDDE